MTYGEFFAACRRLASSRDKTNYSKIEFGKKLGYKDERQTHYSGIENETGKKIPRLPSVDALELAAKLAGLESFQDCIRIPDEVKLESKEEKAIQAFRSALLAGGDRAEVAMRVLESLLQKRPRKKD